MKEIIVAIDFSKGSIHALNYAISIANKTNASILMIWVDTFSEKEGMLLKEQKIMKDEICESFSEIIAKYQPSLTSGKLSFKIRKGKVYSEIAHQARVNKSDLIVVGTHGVSGFEEIFIGSNAFRIVTSAPCPILTIRPDYPFDKGITKIALPIDSTPETCQKLAFTAKLANIFGAEVYVLALYSANLKTINRKVDENAHEVSRYLTEQKVKHSIESVFTDNITKTTLTFAEVVKADVLSIMTEQEISEVNVFLGPNAQQLINHAEIPVLSLKPDEFYEKHK
ncbi:MAG: universal stress protein [Bacteroidota bacterium]